MVQFTTDGRATTVLKPGWDGHWQREETVSGCLSLTLDLCHNIYVHMNSTQRAHIVIPSDLLREIDAIVGPRGRTAFLLETARGEVRRRKLLGFLKGKEIAWKEKDHRDEESAAWVRKLRSESEGRIEAENPQPSRRRRRR